VKYRKWVILPSIFDLSYSFNRWQELFCHCMSHSHPSCLQLPPPGGIRLDTDRYLSQDHIYRSFQINWLTHHLTHTPVFHPWGSLVAGDHYFEWRNKAEPCAFVSILFVITPALHLSEPIVWSEDSTLFKGTSYFVFFYSLPDKLPSDLARWIKDEFVYEGFNPTSSLVPSKPFSTPTTLLSLLLLVL
jgi:hypothetical protein